MVKTRQIAIVLFWNIVTHVINDDESLTNQIPRLQTYKRKSAFLSPVFWIVKVIKRGVVQNTPSSLVLHRQQFLTYRLKTKLLVGFKWFWLDSNGFDSLLSNYLNLARYWVSDIYIIVLIETFSLHTDNTYLSLLSRFLICNIRKLYSHNHI